MFLSSMFLAPLMVLSAILTMTAQRRRLLMSLLALEAMILSLALILTISCLSQSFSNMFLCLIILSFGACEASLGLACLVAMMRSFGSDQISSLSMNKC